MDNPICGKRYVLWEFEAKMSVELFVSNGYQGQWINIKVTQWKMLSEPFKRLKS